jgi:hypothetical protein
MASVPTPLVARFIRKYSSVYGASAGHPAENWIGVFNGVRGGIETREPQRPT